MYNSNKRLTGISKTLRKNMTREEKHLWYDFLKHLDVTFHRQHVVCDYVVDFLCESARLVVEIDGSQHDTEIGIFKDSVRDETLTNLGYTVRRYTNWQIKFEFDSVCNDIEQFIASAGK